MPYEDWNHDDATKMGAALWQVAEPVAALSAGGAHTLILTESGRVLGWGSNDEGQSAIPAGLEAVVGVSAGTFHSLAVSESGEITAWGRGAGRVPAGLRDVVQASAGYNFSVAVRNDGTVVAWGMMGGAKAYVPDGLSDIVSVTAGVNEAFALDAHGRVTAWGGSRARDMVTTMSDIRSIAATGTGWIALRTDGTLDVSRDLGDPGVRESLAEVRAVSAGLGRLSIALKSDGTVASLYDTEGMPPTPHGLRNVTSIACGQNHALALRSDGSIVAWGRNGYFQLQLEPPAGRATDFVGWERRPGYARPLNLESGRSRDAALQRDDSAEVVDFGPRTDDVVAFCDSLSTFTKDQYDAATLAFWSTVPGAGAAIQEAREEVDVANIRTGRTSHAARAQRYSRRVQLRSAPWADETLAADIHRAAAAIVALDHLDPGLFAALFHPFQGSNVKLPAPASARMVRSQTPVTRSAAPVGKDTRAAASSGQGSPGRCYVATAVYGTYDCPEVWVLRRFRDRTLAPRPAGALFVRLYYWASPSLVRFGGTLLKRLARRPLDALVATLRSRGVPDSPYAGG